MYICKQDDKLRFCRAHLRKTQLGLSLRALTRVLVTGEGEFSRYGGCDGSWEIRERGMPVLLPALSSMAPSSGKWACFDALGG